MDIGEMQAAFDDVFDEAIVFHGFATYMRDYEVVIETSAAPSTGIPTRFLRFLFVNCVRADVTTALSPAGWAGSLDERLIDAATGIDLDGYVWGVKWQALYPGFAFVPDSGLARSWSADVGIPFHEVRAQANGHTLTLVFSDLRVEPAPTGYAPFIVPAPGR